MMNLNLPFDLKDFKKNPRQTMILIILLSSVLFLFYFSFILKPQVMRVTDVLGRNGRLMAELKTANSNIAKVEQFKKTIEAYRERVDDYEKRLPAEQEIPSLLENLSNMAKSSNVKIIGITPVQKALKEQRGQKGQTYQEIPILITAKSGYHELGYFLSDLENSDRFMKVTDIAIRTNRVTQKKHDVELMISTYILLREK
jgi:type IV pilus assembly protein PilO